MTTWKRLWLTAVGAFVPVVLIIAGYIGYVLSGTLIVAPHTTGTIAGLGLAQPATIVRDARGIPHIRATSAHDAAFAQGYATASDRLFQLDITRRFALGTLSEMLGATTIATDEQARVVDLRGIAEREYAHLAPDDRAELQAYADGVNAAATHEPQPPEYRMLIYRFAPWKPQDSIAVGFAVVLDLTDSWNDVIARDAVERELGPRAGAAFFSLTDPADDAPTLPGSHVAIPPLPPLDGARAVTPIAWDGDNVHDVLGSNEWAAGGAQTATGRALLANDPHLLRRIPGIWHLVDVGSPGRHIAGAAIAGVPGVVLGHNETLAWGATTADAVSPRVYRETFAGDRGDVYLAGTQHVTATIRHESFDVRFGKASTHDYLSTRHGFRARGNRYGAPRRAVGAPRRNGLTGRRVSRPRSRADDRSRSRRTGDVSRPDAEFHARANRRSRGIHRCGRDSERSELGPPRDCGRNDRAVGNDVRAVRALAAHRAGAHGACGKCQQRTVYGGLSVSLERVL